MCQCLLEGTLLSGVLEGPWEGKLGREQVASQSHDCGLLLKHIHCCPRVPKTPSTAQVLETQFGLAVQNQGYL